jgi:uncharacterized membrane protein YkvA (DUF1232 family)
MAKQEAEVRAAIDRFAARSKPEDIPKVDAQFASKLATLERDRRAPADMIEKLRTLWQLLEAPDGVVPFRSKALAMAALSYFVSPLDLIPDPLGGAGYLDDAMVVRMVHTRLAEEIAACARWRDGREP